MAKTKYSYPHSSSANKSYELVQLLRLNGVQIVRAEGGKFRIRLRAQCRWQKDLLTDYQLRKRFGPGTIAHQILTRHPRASSIIPAVRRNNADLA